MTRSATLAPLPPSAFDSAAVNSSALITSVAIKEPEGIHAATIPEAETPMLLGAATF